MSYKFLFSIFVLLLACLSSYALGFYTCRLSVEERRATSFVDRSLKDSFLLQINNLQKENLSLRQRLGVYADIGAGTAGRRSSSLSVPRFSVYSFDSEYRFDGFFLIGHRSRTHSLSLRYWVECAWLSADGLESRDVCFSPKIAEFSYFIEVSGILSPSEKNKGKKLSRAFLIVRGENFSKKVTTDL